LLGWVNRDRSVYDACLFGQVAKARKYIIATLTSGISMSRLNHLENPAFEKMNQNGRTIKNAIITQKIGPTAPIFIGMLHIVSCMKSPLKMVCLVVIDRFMQAFAFVLGFEFHNWRPRINVGVLPEGF